MCGGGGKEERGAVESPHVWIKHCILHSGILLMSSDTSSFLNQSITELKMNSKYHKLVAQIQFFFLRKPVKNFLTLEDAECLPLY